MRPMRIEPERGRCGYSKSQVTDSRAVSLALRGTFPLHEHFQSDHFESRNSLWRPALDGDEVEEQILVVRKTGTIAPCLTGNMMKWR
jgi:hypothetical protein